MVVDYWGQAKPMRLSFVLLRGPGEAKPPSALSVPLTRQPSRPVPLLGPRARPPLEFLPSFLSLFVSVFVFFSLLTAAISYLSLPLATLSYIRALVLV